MQLPYMKFYVRDWISDPQLRMVTMAARGFWMECLCLMHMAKRRGYMETASGKPINDEHLARLSGTFKGELDLLKEELLDHGIPSVEEATGIWYCRRMVKESQKSEKCSEAGKRGGGNPLLREDQNPDTRTQIPDTTVSIKETFKGDGYTKEFLKFYEAYPKKEAKKAAFRAWQKAKDKPDMDTIIKAIEAQQQSDKWRNGYIPMPATWVNGGGWGDKLQEHQPKGDYGHKIERRIERDKGEFPENIKPRII